MGVQQRPTRRESERERDDKGKTKRELVLKVKDGETWRQKKYKRRQLCSFHSDKETHNRGQECKEREREKMCKHERKREEEGSGVMIGSEGAAGERLAVCKCAG